MAVGDISQPTTTGGGLFGTGILQQLFGGGFTQANPYTQGILQALGGQQASAYGNMNDLISSSMQNFNPTNFLSQFMQNAGGLGQLAQTDYGDFMNGAKQVGQNAAQDVAGQFAGLGSLYSGGAQQGMLQALAQPMYQAYSQAQQQRNSLLNTLYGGAMSGLQQGNVAGLQGGLQGAGLYGGLAGSLGGNLSSMGSPMVMANSTLMDQITSLLGNAGSLGSGMAGVSGAGGLKNIFTGLIG
jgi:hypothetical protein